MLSGVLKAVYDQDPSVRYNLLRRTTYGTFLKGHPAIACIGHPPRGAEVKRVDYWSMEELGPGAQRPFQILARGFGLATPVEERLYIPGEPPADPILEELLPSDRPIVAVAPTSESPRKVVRTELWHRAIDPLLRDGMFVVQLGRMSDQHIRNTYSLRGLTTPMQAIGLLRRCAVVLCVDSFIMHAAHYVSTPAVVLWGPTHHDIYGWPGHQHIQAAKSCGLSDYEDCIGPKHNEGGKLYGSSCPEGPKHCMDLIKPQSIYRAARKVLKY